MFELAGDLGLFDKAGFLAQVSLVKQEFDRDFATEVAVHRTHHRAHAAPGDFPLNGVACVVLPTPGQKLSDGPSARGSEWLQSDTAFDTRFGESTLAAVDSTGRNRCLSRIECWNRQWLFT